MTDDNHHPILGKISQHEVGLILWNRQTEEKWRKESDAKKAYLNAMIEEVKDMLAGLENAWGTAQYEAWCAGIIEKLEKFRDAFT